MTDVLTMLLMWPLPWLLITLLGARIFPKTGPLSHVVAMAGAVLVTTALFGAPHAGVLDATDPTASLRTPLLSAVLAWPALGAIVMLFLPRQWSDGVRRIASVWSWTTFVLSLYLLGPVVRVALAPEADASTSPLVSMLWEHLLLPFFGSYGSDTTLTFTAAGYQLVEDVPWITSFGIHYELGVDGISLWLVLLTTLLTPLALDVSWNSVSTKVKEYAFAFLLLEVGMIGAFIALDLFLFYVFWELMLVPMYLIIGIWGGKERVYASIKFFLYTMAGSLLMLVAIIYVVMQYKGLHPQGLLTFDLRQILGGAVTVDGSDAPVAHQLIFSRKEQLFLFAAFAIAFAIKVPMFPFHTWLPDAHVQAPTGGSVILAAVLLKLGGYGFLRFAMPLFPWASRVVAPTLGFVAIVGIIYGAYCAWVQRDVKKLVAYSSVSHLGFVMLGIFSMNDSAVSGSILQMISHGVSTGALFILVGVLYDRLHTRDLADFGGLAKVMPAYAVVFVIIAMSSIGLPGTNGFVGEFLVLSGSFVSTVFNLAYQKVFTLFAATGVIFSAVYMLHAVLKTFWGPITHARNEKLLDLSERERWILAPLVVLVFWIGLFPNFFIHPMEASVDAFTSTWHERAAATLRYDEAALPALVPIESAVPARPSEPDDNEPANDDEEARRTAPPGAALALARTGDHR